MNPMTPVGTRASSRLAAGALALLLAAPAFLAGAGAQEPGATAGGPARSEVEVIVFRHLDTRGATAEAPPPPGSPATFQGPALPPATLLEPAGLRLAGIAARLRRGPYQVLYHGGWLQPVEREARAAAIALPEAAAQAGLAGSVTVYRERYLYARVDMALAAPAGVADPTAAPVPPAAILRQERRLKGTATHYLDGPVLSVILSVRPAAAPAATAAPATAPPAG